MAADLLIRLLLKDEATKQISTVEGKILNLQNSTKQWMTAISSSAAIIAIATLAKQAVEASAEQEMSIRKLSVAVQNAGYSWNQTNGQILGFIDSLRQTTTYSDNETISVFQKLITYTQNIEEAMRGTKLALDIASSGFADADTAAKLVGKAFEGDVQALGKLIPQLKAANNEQLKHMTSAERTAYALDILQQKFGGMAAGEINTFSGATKQLSNEWNELLRALGDFITKEPNVTNSILLIKGATKGLADQLDALRNNKQAKSMISDSISALFGLGTADYTKLGSLALGFGANIGSGGKLNASQESVETLATDQDTKNQLISQEQRFQNDRAQTILQGEEVINSIQRQYGDIAKNMMVDEKLFKVQQELEKVNSVINTGQLEKSVADQVYAKKVQLLEAERQLKKQQTKLYLDEAQTVWAMFSQTVTMAIGENKKYAGLMKAMRMGEAIINTATAATKAYAEVPWPMSLVVSGLMMALGAAQVGIIAAQPMAEGGEGIVRSPTLFLAGEAGPERFSFTPTNRINNLGRSGNGTNITNHFNFDNITIRDERDIDTLTEEISRKMDLGMDRMR